MVTGSEAGESEGSNIYILSHYPTERAEFWRPTRCRKGEPGRECRGGEVKDKHEESDARQASGAVLWAMQSPCSAESMMARGVQQAEMVGWRANARRVRTC
eukprot:764675-Hanusia_phi.AAC.3